jgi:hypothetical protein
MKRLITTLAVTATLLSCSQTPTNADAIRVGYQALNAGNFTEAETKFNNSYAGFKEKNIPMGMFHALIALGELEFKRKNLAAAKKYYDDAYDSIAKNHLQPDGISFYKLLSQQLLVNKQLFVQAKHQLTDDELTLALYQQRNERIDQESFTQLTYEVLTIPAALLAEIRQQYPDGNFRRDIERQIFVQKMKQARTFQDFEALLINYTPEKIAKLNRVWRPENDQVTPLSCMKKLASNCFEHEVLLPIKPENDIYVLENFGEWIRVFNTNNHISGWVKTNQLKEVYSSRKRMELRNAVLAWELANSEQISTFVANKPTLFLPIYNLLSADNKTILKPALRNALGGKTDFDSMLALYNIDGTSDSFHKALAKVNNELQYDAILEVTEGKIPSFGVTAANATLARIYRSQGDESSLRKAFKVSASAADLELLVSKLQNKEQLEGFLIEYKDFFPSVLTNAKLKLAALYVLDRTAASYFRAFELTGRAKEGELALNSAQTQADRQKLEQLVLQRSAPSAVFDINVNQVNSTTKSNDGSGSFLSFARYRLSTFSLSYGTIAIKPNPRSPIQLGAGAYKIKIETTGVAPVQYMRESQWQGSDNSQRVASESKSHEVIVQPPSYSATINPLLADVETAMVQRGMMGGVSAHMINGPIEISYRITSIEAVPYQGSSAAPQVNFAKLTDDVSNQIKQINIYDTMSASQDQMQDFLRIDSERAEEIRREQLRQNY